MSCIVLKHGSWFYKEVCPRCGCEFSFTPHDLSYEYNNIGDWNETHIESIYCPECYHQFKWPEFTHHSIEEKDI